MSRNGNWPIGMPRGVEGNAEPWPADYGAIDGAPLNVIALAGTGTIPLPSGCYVEVAGSFTSGWTIQPNGANAGNVPLVATACFPAPRDSKLIVSAAGSGSPVLILWPRHVGERISSGRGFAPSGSAAGTVPSGRGSQFTTSGRAAPAVAGTRIVGPVTVPTAAVVITDEANASAIFFADTQAKAALLGAAGGGQPLYATGADIFPLLPGGTDSLWAASADGLQVCYLRSET